MGYMNPLLKLPSVHAILAMPKDQREPLEALLRDLRADADRQAEQAWKKRKGPMAAYWRAVSTYARHTAHALSKGTYPPAQVTGPEVPMTEKEERIHDIAASTRQFDLLEEVEP